MKTNIMNERESDKSISDALATGALLWAPVYSVIVSTVIYFLTQGSTEPVQVADILLKALLVFSPLCIVAEASRWLLTSKIPVFKQIGFKKQAKLQRIEHFVPPGSQPQLHHKHA